MSKVTSVQECRENQGKSDHWGKCENRPYMQREFDTRFRSVVSCARLGRLFDLTASLVCGGRSSACEEKLNFEVNFLFCFSYWFDVLGLFRVSSNPPWYQSFVKGSSATNQNMLLCLCQMWLSWIERHGSMVRGKADWLYRFYPLLSLQSLTTRVPQEVLPLVLLNPILKSSQMSIAFLIPSHTSLWMSLLSGIFGEHQPHRMQPLQHFDSRHHWARSMGNAYPKDCPANMRDTTASHRSSLPQTSSVGLPGRSMVTANSPPVSNSDWSPLPKSYQKSTRRRRAQHSEILHLLQ